ncbi:MAG: T9SS type A sorting domain-containing protein [Sphingobacteriia bacterium]|nr:T9SS type A sorting domain-containing protein [Sphingobacteriia bacterium]
MQIVQLYPNSTFAKAALKKIVSLESVTGKNYINLINYLSTNSVIQNNGELKMIANRLIVQCNIEQGTYPEAIDILTQKFSDPDIQHYDSIFTALDLEYVNYLLSNSQKTSGIISLNELLNNEVGKNYMENSDRLIAQLFKNDKDKKTGANYNDGLEFAHLFQNYPNPAGNLTNIRFSLAEESIVDISLFSINGQFVKTLKKAAFNKGLNNCYVNLKDLKPGVYFYRLMVKGNTSEYQKMIISR